MSAMAAIVVLLLAIAFAPTPVMLVAFLAFLAWLRWSEPARYASWVANSPEFRDRQVRS